MTALAVSPPARRRRCGWAQRAGGCKVEPLPGAVQGHFDQLYGDPHGREKLDAVEERLADNLITPPPEHAAFRERLGMILDDMHDKKPGVVKSLAAGDDPQDVAAEHGVSPGACVADPTRSR